MQKITDLTNKVAHISEKGFDFLSDRMFFTGHNGCKYFLVFTQMVSSLILDTNKKLTNCKSTGISPEKIKALDTNLNRECLI